VISRQDDLAIAVCGTGIGISIAANKVPGIRAACAHERNTAKLAREHNNATVLTLGRRVVTGAQAIEMVQDFLNTPFGGSRHEHRVEKIALIEIEERGRASSSLTDGRPAVATAHG
jgi:ribose 5-phosphate isomerase B